jgi:hypothetical protein
MRDERRLRRLKPKDARHTSKGSETTSRRVVGAKHEEGGRRPVAPAAAPQRERVQEHGTRERRTERRDEDSRRRGGVPWWAWLLGLLAIGALLFALFAGGDSSTDAGGSAGSQTTEQNGTSGDAGGAAGSGEVGTAAAPGTLSAGSTDLLPIAGSGGDLGRYEGQAVEGNAVTVESVVGDEAVWIGKSPSERIFAWLNLKGESGPDIDAGDQVNLSGTVEHVSSGLGQDLGVTSSEGVDQLEQQGSYVEVTQVEKS